MERHLIIVAAPRDKTHVIVYDSQHNIHVFFGHGYGVEGGRGTGFIVGTFSTELWFILEKEASMIFGCLPQSYGWYVGCKKARESLLAVSHKFNGFFAGQMLYVKTYDMHVRQALFDFLSQNHIIPGVIPVAE